MIPLLFGAIAVLFSLAVMFCGLFLVTLGRFNELAEDYDKLLAELADAKALAMQSKRIEVMAKIASKLVTN